VNRVHAAALAVSAGVLLFASGPGLSGLLLLSYVLWRAACKGRARRVSRGARRRRVWTDDERRLILERDGWACVWCGSTDELQIDHVVPFSRGGACSADNAVVLCGPCNRRKGAS
jgi:5-methylcytosine-specific restriction endonuclease McrA